MASKALASSIQVPIAALLLVGSLLFISPVQASAQANSRQKSQSAACPAADVNYDLGTDVNAIDKFDAAIAQLLTEQKFDDLDCLADSLRSGKSKFSGGAWKIHNYYGAFDGPTGHATEEDWKEYLGQLERWVAAKPGSVTARIALAESYINHAWYARGEGTSDSVTGSGWKLFGQRLDRAKQILDEAAKLPQKCPEWYVVMQQVALGQNWSVSQETALFEKAIAFEPSYYYYYRMHANFILPKWNGEEGDSSRFAERAADHVGGTRGDILYFEIASQLVCRCDEPEFTRMSWPRVQRGYAELEKESGISLINLNKFALMATRAKNSETADPIFKRIGDEWAKEDWGTEEYFKQAKSWAASAAPAEAHFRQIREASDANMKTAEGQRYRKEFDQKLSTFMQTCAKNNSSNLDKFEFIIQVKKDGAVAGISMPYQTPVAGCLFETLMRSEMTKEKPFPRPPHDIYAVVLELDPASFLVASK